MINRALVDELRQRQNELAEKIVTEIYQLHSRDWEGYGRQGYQYSLRDMQWNLSFLIQALDVETPELFSEYLKWLKGLFYGLGFAEGSINRVFLTTKEVIARELKADEIEEIGKLIDEALKRVENTADMPESFLLPANEMGLLAQGYLKALLSGDRNQARHLILSAVEAGRDIKEIYLEVFQRVQYEVGRLWQLRIISVAQEHFCTSATQMIMAQLYHRVFSTPKKEGTMIGCSIGGELHEMGIRMVSDFFELEGWKTMYLGASTPVADIIDAVKKYRPRLLCVSATLYPYLMEVRKLIAVLKNETAGDLKILVGGYPFNVSPDLWRRMGADGYAPNAMLAVRVASEIIER